MKTMDTENIAPAKTIAKKGNRFHHNLLDVEIVEMTEPIVETLLAGNIDNRKINRTNIEKIKYEISHGKYQFTGEPVIRDDYGYLRDGQHRLLALKELGYPKGVVMVVETLHGEKSDIDTVARYMNIGKSRTFSVLLRNMKVENPRAIASICRQIPYIIENYGGKNAYSDSYYLDMISMYRRELEMFAPLVKKGGLRVPTAVAACTIARVTGCGEEILEMCKKALNADMLKLGSPEHTLNKILNNHYKSNKRGQAVVALDFAYAAHAFIAHLNNDNYPVPNGHVNTACKWILDMAKDNRIFIMPKNVECVKK